MMTIPVAISLLKYIIELLVFKKLASVPSLFPSLSCYIRQKNDQLFHNFPRKKSRNQDNRQRTAGVYISQRNLHERSLHRKNKNEFHFLYLLLLHIITTVLSCHTQMMSLKLGANGDYFKWCILVKGPSEETSWLKPNKPKGRAAPPVGPPEEVPLTWAPVKIQASVLNRLTFAFKW